MLTKIFLAMAPKKPLDRSTAWACVMTNLLILPGLGSLFAGRWVGFAQIVLSITGMILSIICLGWVTAVWFPTQTLPTEFNAFMWMGLGGVVFFMTSWFWALISSILILRGAPK